jgi:glycosyltransferase involved in cell wall biosynthesis
MENTKKVLQIEGWRDINHSFSIVNQFHLLELLKDKTLEIQHLDLPYLMPHWNKSNNGVGFNQHDDQLLNDIPPPTKTPDAIFRICSPTELSFPRNIKKLCVFVVTEVGLTETNLLNQKSIEHFQSLGGLIATPSRWSRDRLIHFGFSESNIHVVPHAAKVEYFHPIPVESIEQVRKNLSIGSDEIVLLNIAGLFWNKGMDVLLKAFAVAKKNKKNLRLILKDQRHTYTVQGEDFINQTLTSAGLNSDEIMKSITLIPSNLNLEQMKQLYCLADYYVSAYRAEGFNLPVLEAITCGTPVIVSAGGATDDFVIEGLNKKIESNFYEKVTLHNNFIDGYVEPNLEHLIDIFLSLERKSITSPPTLINESFKSWGPPTEKLKNLLGLI